MNPVNPTSDVPEAGVGTGGTPVLGPHWGRPVDAPDSPVPDASGRVTIGVTLDIPEPYASELRALRLSHGDQAALVVPAHITLVPPMEIPVESWPEVRDRIREVANATSPFILGLRGTGTFMPISPVVFIEVVRGLRECRELSTSLRSGVLDQDLAFPYHPHVTIAQGLDATVLEKALRRSADYEVEFMSHGFGVYFHGPSGTFGLHDLVPFGP